MGLGREGGSTPITQEFAPFSLISPMESTRILFFADWTLFTEIVTSLISDSSGEAGTSLLCFFNYTHNVPSKWGFSRLPGSTSQPSICCSAGVFSMEFMLKAKQIKSLVSIMTG